MRERSRTSERSEVLAFVGALAAHRRRAAEVVLLTLALGLTEWVGLLVLIPLLALVGLRDTQGEAGRLADVVAGLLSRVGLHPTLPSVLVVFLALVAARALLQRRDTVVASALEQEFVLQLRRRLYEAIARSRWVHFSRQRVSDFTHALTSDLDRVALATSQLLRLVGQTVLSVAYIAFALRVSPTLTALAAVAGATLLLMLRGARKRARASGEQISATGAEVYSAVHEHLGGLKTARTYGAEERNAAIFNSLAGQVAESEMGAMRNYATSSALFAIGSAAVLGAFVYLSVAVAKLPTTAVLLLLLVFSRLVPRFSSALDGYQYFVGALPSYRNVTRRIAECEAEAEVRPAAEPTLPELRDAVRLHGVSFQYDTNSETRAIDDIDLEIVARQTTAIVGVSGAGKSTIADLILGLITPEAGTISIDAVTLTPERSRAWRSCIGFVPQDTFLLNDTVRANLLWAQPSASEQEVRLALRQAQSEAFVQRLPNGLDTVIGDRGVLLSGGERQRLALARALLRKPKLLILDEATSALDSENEQRIRGALADLGGELTVLIITHRLSTIRDADTIHVIDQGRLVQSGRWDELLAIPGGRFHSLCAAQGALDT